MKHVLMPILDFMCRKSRKDCLQDFEYEKRDFDDLNPQDYGIQFEDEDHSYGKYYSLIFVKQYLFGW